MSQGSRMKEINLGCIVGDAVKLRPITLQDTPLVVRWRNNPMVMKNFIFQEIFTEEIHNQWMNTKVASGEVIQYIIEEKETGRSIGSVYLRDIDWENESAEFGIFIGEDDARGRGYGTEATKKFVEYMFQVLHLHRIFLRVLDGNESAWRSYEKAGFVKEGKFRHMVKIRGFFQDVIFMAIVKEKEVLEDV